MPLDLVVRESAEEIYVRCAHDGYMRLKNKSLHIREWVLRKSGIQIRDQINGTFNKAFAYYHFHPNVHTHLDDSGRQGRAELSSGELVQWQTVGGIAKILESTYHPHFGQTVRNKCLAIVFEKPTCELKFSWN